MLAEEKHEPPRPPSLSAPLDRMRFGIGVSLIRASISDKVSQLVVNSPSVLLISPVSSTTRLSVGSSAVNPLREKPLPVP